MIIMKGMNVQASIVMMPSLAIPGVAKKAGLSQPSQRAKRAAGPKRYSISDLPIIQLTATGVPPTSGPVKSAPRTTSRKAPIVESGSRVQKIAPSGEPSPAATPDLKSEDSGSTYGMSIIRSATPAAASVMQRMSRSCTGIAFAFMGPRL